MKIEKKRPRWAVSAALSAHYRLKLLWRVAGGTDEAWEKYRLALLKELETAPHADYP